MSKIEKLPEWAEDVADLVPVDQWYMCGPDFMVGDSRGPWLSVDYGDSPGVDYCVGKLAISVDPKFLPVGAAIRRMYEAAKLMHPDGTPEHVYWPFKGAFLVAESKRKEYEEDNRKEYAIWRDHKPVPLFLGFAKGDNFRDACISIISSYQVVTTYSGGTNKPPQGFDPDNLTLHGDKLFEEDI